MAEPSKLKRAADMMFNGRTLEAISKRTGRNRSVHIYDQKTGETTGVLTQGDLLLALWEREQMDPGEKPTVRKCVTEGCLKVWRLNSTGSKLRKLCSQCKKACEIAREAKRRSAMDPKTKEKRRAYARKYAAKPEVRAKVRDAKRALAETPEGREKKRAAHRAWLEKKKRDMDGEAKIARDAALSKRQIAKAREDRIAAVLADIKARNRQGEGSVMAQAKVCSCGRRYSVEEWGALPRLGSMRCPADEHGPAEHVEMRNCVCGSTMGVDLKEVA